jgi:hypothetical protein
MDFPPYTSEAETIRQVICSTCPDSAMVAGSLMSIAAFDSRIDQTIERVVHRASEAIAVPDN